MTRSDEDGRLGAPLFPLTTNVIPTRLELVDGDLCWWWSCSGQKAERPRDAVTVGALDAFIRLRSGQDVLRFAGRYGVLNICEHGVPASHNPMPPMAGFGGYNGPGGCFPAGWEHGLVREPIDAWFHFARQAAAMLRVGAALRQGQPGSPTDWGTIFVASERPLVPEDLSFGRIVLSNVVNEWLAIGNVRPTFRWWSTAEAPVFTLGGGAFANLAVQLMLAISGSQAVAVCDGCQRTYFRQGRSPQAKRRNFCSDCGEPMRARLSKRDQRTRSTCRDSQISRKGAPTPE